MAGAGGASATPSPQFHVSASGTVTTIAGAAADGDVADAAGGGGFAGGLAGSGALLGSVTSSVAGVGADRRVTLHFSIPYHTQWGQSLILCGSGALLGNMEWSKGKAMACHHDKESLVWEVTAVLPWKPCYTYKYALVRQRDDDSAAPTACAHGPWLVEKEDASGERTVWLPEGLQGGDLLEVCDTWVDKSHPAALMASAAFTEVLFSHRPVVQRNGLPVSERCHVVPGETVIRLQIADYQLQAGESLFVTGGIPQLGNWQADQMLALIETHTPYWEAEIRVPYTSFSFTYKYAIRTEEGVVLEAGEPRLAALPPSSTAVGAPSVMVRHDGFFRHDRFWRGAGIAAPVFSLRTRESVGVGEFLDLIPLVDLADRCELRLIQVLPVNDTCVYGNWWDSYPYSTLSVHALHPQYLALRALLDPEALLDAGCDAHAGVPEPGSPAAATRQQQQQAAPINGAGGGASASAAAAAAAAGRSGSAASAPHELPEDLAAELAQARQRLDGPHVDYTATVAFKAAFAKKVFDRYGDATMQSRGFQSWFADNAEWLRPYAAFCLLRDLFQTAEHWRWGSLSGAGASSSRETGGVSVANEGVASVVERLTAPGGEWWPRVQLTYYVQYHLHRQLKRVADYARSRHVVLKGDLPIGVDKRSVDTWVAPHLFRMDKSTGAPPDAFSPTGQNWGFPTYDWEAMAGEGFAWWRSRLAHLSQYFTCLRVDHVLGFFRIWEVPADCVTGMLGYFRPSKPITRSELEQRGLWDVQRLAQPLITQALLRDAFGSAARAEEVAARYMLEDGHGHYRLRPAFASEAAISAIQPRDGSPTWLVEEVAATRKGLMALRQDVCLIPDPEDPDMFHPRFNLMATRSYSALAAPLRAALRHLHDDYFFRRQEDLWRASALSKLPALQAASDMLICGEDLGFVPACVPPVMKELGLVGLRIQRMSTEADKEFNNPAAYPYLAVASPSCHDVTPLRAWYESDLEQAERFYYAQLGGCGPPPATCSPEVVRAVLQQHINCPAMLAIFPIQDLMALSLQYAARPALEEVINDPTVSKHYWRYRIHVPLEQLIANDDWCDTVAEMLVLGERAAHTGAALGLTGH